MAVKDRFKNLWNIFRNANTAGDISAPHSQSFSYGVRPDRTYLLGSNERSIISSILTRISIDVASVPIRHVSTDSKNRYTDDIDSGLSRCLLYEANLDQGPRYFRQDIALSMLDSNKACIVPIDVMRDENGNVADILTLRVGKIVDWYSTHVRVSLYNQETMRREEVVLPKTFVAIPDNPLYTVMNGPNSTLNRLIRKLNLLDVIDEKSGSDRLDMIIQLPYTVRSEVKREQINQRTREIQQQLASSQYGIAWADATEKIIQLNRPVENNLLGQIEFLTKMLYGQLGLTEAIMDGTADEKAMLNYFNRTVEPILESIIEAMTRTFLGVEAWARGERLRYYQNPFKLVPISDFADIADKLSRNEILSSNEIRGFLGIEPHDDPRADELVNSNINPAGMSLSDDGSIIPNAPEVEDDVALNSGLDEIEKALDDVFSDLGV